MLVEGVFFGSWFFFSFKQVKHRSRKGMPDRITTNMALKNIFQSTLKYQRAWSSLSQMTSLPMQVIGPVIFRETGFDTFFVNKENCSKYT